MTRPPFEFAGRTAFVTGAASGIGLAIACALLAKGVRVALADWDRDSLATVVADLGDAALAIPLDVTDREAWGRAKAATEAHFGPVSILVNNAGIAPDGNPLDSMPEAHFDRMVAIKLTGTYNGIRSFVPTMRAAGDGHIVNTASMAGLNIRANLGAYTASKFAIVGLSEVLRAELEPVGVGVSVLCPGLVATNLGINSGRGALPGGIDAAIVADQVIDGITHNHLHIITHVEQRSAVEHRMQRVLSAFDRVTDANSK